MTLDAALAEAQPWLREAIGIHRTFTEDRPKGGQGEIGDAAWHELWIGRYERLLDAIEARLEGGS